MSKLLMSIKPQYVTEILCGRKLYEFRKSRCKHPVTSVLIYATAPIQKVVAEVEITDIWEDSPSVLWSKTFHAAGISKEKFDRYFENRSYAVAYCLGAKTIFNPTLNISDLGLTHPPQSYCYIE